jgi:hypothetical protein
MTFTLSLRDRCLALAEAKAWEINGDIDYIDQDDLETCLSGLTEENLEETAEQLAWHAHLCS